jgi:acyl carrier protein
MLFRRTVLLSLLVTLAIGCDRGPTAPAPSAVANAPSDSIEAKVHRIVAEQFGVSVKEVRNNVSFRADLKADELDDVELVMECEDVFHISIPDEDIASFKTVGDLVVYIERQKPSAPTTR